MLSFNARSQCDIYQKLQEMGLNTEIETNFQLKNHIFKESGGTLYHPYFERFLKEKNPAFSIDGPLTYENLIWMQKFKDSGALSRLKAAVSHIKINPEAPIPEFDAKYLVGKELALVDDVFLHSNHMADVNLVVTNDNVTTYWKHLDGIPVRGHDPSVTWNSIPGAGAPDGVKELVIALHKGHDGSWYIPKGNHGSKNLVLHEFAHAFDKIVGHAIDQRPFSKSEDFYRSWYNEYSSGNLKEAYYLQPDNNYSAALEESFAEGFAKYYGADIAGSYDWPYITSYFYNTLRVHLSNYSR
ncbi:TPA: peptidase [Vibrio parahaemolyticus]|nr:peptidase [Vibrio parahaemolyticus]